ncbi:MAG: DEAD/DEAH box helicase [Cellulomonas sp.]|nr:DEAD/DEAH box helicase [Cellulomonas sp.]
MASSFAALGVPAPLVDVLTASGIDAPFPIQRDTLPDTLDGRDVLGRGRTGSGKTLAFALPMVARIAADRSGRRRPGHPRGLVLAPTRELATQIAEVIAPLARAVGLEVTTIFGGVSQHRQVVALAAGVDIVVACPGRLEDLMHQKHANLDSVTVTVLDEADHMADLGFLPTVTRIMAATPVAGQRMLFSATLDNGVDRIVRKFLHAPVTHAVDDASSHVDQMVHEVLTVSGADVKRDVVHALASGTGPRILFVRTKHVAKKLAKALVADGIAAVDLQGNLSQAARDRNLAALRDGRARVLVATDVAARGVHVDDVALVVHVDPPTEHKSYLHRSGRTARAGAAGTVVTLVLPEQRREVHQMLRAASIKATPVEATAASAVVQRLVGERAPRISGPVVEVAEQRPAAARGSRGGAGSARRSGGAGSGRSGGAGSGRSGGPTRTIAEAVHANEAARSGEARPARRRGRGAAGTDTTRTDRGTAAGAGRQGGRGGAPSTRSTSGAAPRQGAAPAGPSSAPRGGYPQAGGASARPARAGGSRRANRPTGPVAGGPGANAAR